MRTAVTSPDGKSSFSQLSVRRSPLIRVAERVFSGCVEGYQEIQSRDATVLLRKLIEKPYTNIIGNRLFNNITKSMYTYIAMEKWTINGKNSHSRYETTIL